MSDNIVKIKVLGAGGAGGNAINDMITTGVSGVEFIAANTDAQDLSKSLADVRIQLGEKLTRGLGAGANPEIGRQSAEEDIDKLKQLLEDTDMLFITAGMGGGTGTGSSPVIAKVAKELGILTVGIVTKPFGFEGGKRRNNAEKGIAELKQYVDSLVVIPNDKLFELPDKTITLSPFFSFMLYPPLLYSTSLAKLMIFIKSLSLSSRATGPKTRVPTGDLSSLIITQALSSNLI